MCDCCKDVKLDFTPIEDVVGPSINYHRDPIDSED